jgi:hypothetical protein
MIYTFTIVRSLLLFTTSGLVTSKEMYSSQILSNGRHGYEDGKGCNQHMHITAIFV